MMNRLIGLLAGVLMAGTAAADFNAIGKGVGPDESTAYDNAYHDGYYRCHGAGGYPLTFTLLRSEATRAFPNGGYGGVLTPCADCWEVVLQVYCRVTR